MAEKKIVVTRGPSLITPPGRCSFPKLTEPETFQGKTFYTVHVLIPKKGSDFKEMVDAFQVLIDEKWPNEGFTLEDMDYSPFMDGDNMKKQFDGYAGCIYVRPSMDVKDGVPPIFGPDKATIPANRIYSGALIRCLVTPGVWEGPFGRGAKLYLDSVQFLEDRPRFGRVAVNASEILTEWKNKKATGAPAAKVDTASMDEATPPKKASAKMSMTASVPASNEEDEEADTQAPEEATPEVANGVPIAKKAKAGKARAAGTASTKSLLSSL